MRERAVLIFNYIYIYIYIYTHTHTHIHHQVIQLARISLTLTIRPYHSSHPAGHLDYVLCLYKAVVVCSFWSAKNGISIYRNPLENITYELVLTSPAVGWVLWHINLCRSFNTKSIFILIICSISNNSI